MPSDLSAKLVGPLVLWGTTLFYGMNIIFFIACLRILLKPRSPGDRIPWLLLGGITIQFLISTTHMVMVLAATLHAFLKVDTTASALIAEWNDIFVVYTETQQLLYGLNNFFGDLIMLWRLYVVFSQNAYVCVVPLLMVIVTGVLNIYTTTFIYINPTKILDAGTRAVLEKSVTADFILEALSQLLLTGLIGGKIWWTSRAAGRRYMGVVWMLVESGAFLAVIDFVYLGVWRAQLSGFSQVGLGMLGQLSALIPLTIIVRVGLGVAVGSKKSTHGSRSHQEKISMPSWNRSGSNGVTSTTAGTESITLDPTKSEFNGGSTVELQPFENYAV